MIYFLVLNDFDTKFSAKDAEKILGEYLLKHPNDGIAIYEMSKIKFSLLKDEKYVEEFLVPLVYEGNLKEKDIVLYVDSLGLLCKPYYYELKKI